MTAADASLRVHEWLSIAAVTIAFGVIATLSWALSSEDLEEVAKEGFVWVDVEGCVRQPGSFQLPIGSTVQQALDMAEPLPDAIYQGIRRTAVVKNGQLIRVKEQSWMTVYLEGEVTEPGEFKVRRGARLSDLIETAPLTKEADISSLMRKRRLKSGEHIVVMGKKDQQDL